MAQRKLGRPAQLDKNRIVAAGLELDLDTLTMPLVAKQLNVSTQALYYWVADRDELLNLISEVVAERINPNAPLRDNDWRAWLTDLAWHMFRELLAIPGYAGRISDRPHATPSYLRMHDTIIRTLIAAGLAEDVAKDTWDVFGTCVIGWLATLQRRDPDAGEHGTEVRYPPLSGKAQSADAERRFEVLVATLIRGLPAKR